MKKIFFLLTVLTVSLTSFAQKTTSIHYNLKIESTSDEAAMMAGFMDGSSMLIATDGLDTYVKTVFGMIYTMEIETNTETKIITMLMTGMIGDMAFQGNSDELEDDEEKTEEPELKLINEKKTILGYKCKKAILTDEEGNESIYWYTNKIERPDVDQMPNAIPGVCLEMVVVADGMKITYTADELDDKANMADFKVIIPEEIEIQPLSAMSSMGQ